MSAPAPSNAMASADDTPTGGSSPGTARALTRVFYAAGTVSFLAVGVLMVMTTVPAARDKVAMGILCAMVAGGLWLYPALRKAIAPSVSLGRKRLVSTLAFGIALMSIGAGFRVRSVQAVDLGPWLSVFLVASGGLLAIAAIRAFLALTSTNRLRPTASD